jgi:tRNA nucleotidyltransferase/poly(A) polymerase
MWYRISKTALASEGIQGQFKLEMNLPLSSIINKVIDQLHAIPNVSVYAVGGSVRDELLGVAPKDIDFEVYGFGFDDLASFLSQFGRVDLVGKQFGVIKFTDSSGEVHDFTVPRKDNKTGTGHRGFEVETDPNLTPKDASARRDFPQNALMYNLRDKMLHDYYGGLESMGYQSMDEVRARKPSGQHVLRVNSDKFAEDYLRVLRGGQFSARFDAEIDDSFASVSREIADRISPRFELLTEKPDLERNSRLKDEFLSELREYCERFERAAALTGDPQFERAALSAYDTSDAATGFAEKLTNLAFPELRNKLVKKPANFYEFAEAWFPPLSKSRVVEEWSKWARKSKKPSRIFDFLEKTGWDRFYPEIAAMRGVPQEEEWHPEGNVDIHTRHVVDAANEIAQNENLTPEDREVLVLSGLLHDVAKPLVTKIRQKKDQSGNPIDRITSHGHEEAGGPITQAILERMGFPKNVVQKVVKLVMCHMRWHNLGDNPAPKTVYKLAQVLYPATIEELVRLVAADYSGRPPLPKGVPDQAQRLLDVARRLGVHDSPLQPLLQGRDLINEYYDGQGNAMIGEALRAVYAEQMLGRIQDRDSAQQWLRERMGGFLVNADDLRKMGVTGNEQVKSKLREIRVLYRSGAVKTRQDALNWLKENKPVL